MKKKEAYEDEPWRALWQPFMRSSILRERDSEKEERCPLD